MQCWKCKSHIKVEEIFRTTECPVCHADLHVCKGCEFFSPGNHFDCKENIDDLVSDKEKSNFCDYFRTSKKISADLNAEKAKAAKDAFNALFS